MKALGKDVRQLTRGCFLYPQGGWMGNKISQRTAFVRIPSNQIKETQARAAQRAGTKFTCSHDSGEILMTIQLERKMSQRLPFDHAREKFTRKSTWHLHDQLSHHLVKTELKMPRFHFGSSLCQNNNAPYSGVNKCSKENLNVG